MLFLTFIKGPDVQEWSNMQVGWLGSRILAGAGRNEEHLYDEVMDSFKTAFTDTMSLQKAKAEFRTIKMEKGELDMYIAKFERLARLAGYSLQDQMVLNQFGSGLKPRAIRLHYQQYRASYLVRLDQSHYEIPTEVLADSFSIRHEDWKCHTEVAQEASNTRTVESSLEQQKGQ